MTLQEQILKLKEKNSREFKPIDSDQYAVLLEVIEGLAHVMSIHEKTCCFKCADDLREALASAQEKLGSIK